MRTTVRLPVIETVEDVAQRQLCCGCGACAYISPSTIEMVDSLNHGRRPRFKSQCRSTADDQAALRVCPGIGLEHRFDVSHPDLISELVPGWGPVLEVWEGHATDDAIRFAGSSGGAASALALACIEQAGMHGVLHIKARADVPYLNHTVLSTTRQEILSATGSRYAPASPCDGLQLIEDAPAPCVFIGKPCDVAAVDKAKQVRPALAEKVGVTIAFFCAGTPTTNATFKLLRRMGVDDPSQVVELRYRGNGWPGEATVTLRTEDGIETRSMSYEESWGEILTNDKQWRCHVCADHTGEFADIAVGDPWYRRVGPNERGSSLVLVRTERGRGIVRQAIEHGYLTLTRADASILPRSQPNLLRGRGAVWARILVSRLMGVHAPRYRGFPMLRFWLTKLSGMEKLRSILGTARRVMKRGLGDRVTIVPFTAHDSTAESRLQFAPNQATDSEAAVSQAA